MSNEDIADKLDINAPPVRLCLSKFERVVFKQRLKILLAVDDQKKYTMILSYGLLRKARP